MSSLLQQQQPSPHSIAVATLIALHTGGCESDGDGPSPLYDDADADDSSKQEALFGQVEGVLQDLLLQRMVMAVDGGDDHSHDDTNTGSRHRAPATVRSLLERLPAAAAGRLRAWLTAATDTVDGLVDLVAALQVSSRNGAATLATAAVDAASVRGAFLRAVAFQFEQLSFAAALELRRALRRELSEEDEDEDDNGGDAESAPRRTRDEAAHFDEFRQCLRAGERVGAAHALHRYLDHALIGQARQREEQSLSASSSRDLERDATDGESAAAHSNSNSDTSSSSVLPLAPILNAVLHESFGEDALLEAAVHEAVRVAQQQQSSSSSSSSNAADDPNSSGNHRACAAFALGWLGVLAAARGSGAAVPLLQRCAERCGGGDGSHLRALRAGALLEQAALTRDWRPWLAATAGGGATATAGSGDRSGGSSHSSSTAAVGGSGDRPMSLALAAETTTASNSGNNNAVVDPVWTARQHLVAAGLWHHRGQGWLAAHATQAALGHANGNKNALSSPDCAGAIRNASVSLLSGGDCDARRLFGDSDDEKGNGDDDDDDDDICCVYGNALRALVQWRDAHQLPVGGGDTFLLEAALLVHEWAVRRNQFDDAEAILVECFSHEHPRTYSSRGCARLEICTQQAFLRSRQGRHREAQDLLTKEISRLAANSSSNDHRARLLLQLSLVHLECCRQQQPNNSSNSRCTAVLAPLLECLTLSERLGMTGLHAEALSVLGQVHWRNGDCRRAVAAVRAALPQLLQPCGTHVALQAEAYFTLARCHADLASAAASSSASNHKSNKKNSSNNKSRLHLKRAVREFRRSEQGFAACHDVERLKETYYWQARTHHALNMVAERDAASEKFVRLTSSSTTNNSNWANENTSKEQQKCNNNGPASYYYPNPLTSLSNREELLKLASRPGPAAVV